ncbi:MAG: transcription elongation factor Elf1 [Candidatus Aramenus sulfurataquae]|jgi:transcription elongation factor Elf1|uniref:Transcription elongation factor n=2 Tax=Candidatus Aramenus sulfurataquae TaxID=1326980 RepID=W7KIT4_9CREN|nr:MAG: transcription elongation factor Elf1 [Candidatus Aramenus sulfurataquae]MCL7343381.1 transcription elongation factor [Candidatus Aramenus sulfurataquae]
MGGKRKKRTKIIKPKPKLPKTFECPRCGRISISVEIKDGLAKIRCGSCNLYAEVEVPPVYDEANAYGKFLDLYLDGKLQIKENPEDNSEGENETERESEELHQESN